MLSVPIPLVVSLLFGLLTIGLYFTHRDKARAACVFLLFCTLSTAVIGLRWAYPSHLLPIIQPILASLVPVAAWYTFKRTQSPHRLISFKHLVLPCLIVTFVASHLFWPAPIDELLTLGYLLYGLALIKKPNTSEPYINVTLGSWEGVTKAKRLAGIVLIFSAAVDSFIYIDITYHQSQWVPYILTAAHLTLLPVLSLAVVITGIATITTNQTTTIEPKQEMLSVQIQEIAAKLDKLLSEKEIYLEPDITLARLSRKLGIPAKQVSSAVNQIHGKNISRLVNEYRIEHAKRSLINTDQSVTQIFINSGFQTKSNFNREFARVTEMSPSQYRKQRHNEAGL
ncbi:helix-turn-helix domain-containing protein [Vibrio hepatarius]|uniref:helix-turn-helix domain-containing protein n=1 Tax=Vibrio hepatarius TaxID=171383 RepID=UPI001C080E04|nr:helix-turn-helix domain-containing protein [Vibrio hepatarius]MBU2897067.1 helix-turn-helix domain-containing protein [Vibrio hepatarius]